jgi:K+/H+ antiporter YhaU regulatory subunit KhtT
LVLALRGEDGAFLTNPSPDTTIRAGEVLIAIGTPGELDALAELVNRDNDPVADRNGERDAHR